MSFCCLACSFKIGVVEVTSLRKAASSWPNTCCDWSHSKKAADSQRRLSSEKVTLAPQSEDTFDPLTNVSFPWPQNSLNLVTIGF